MQYIPSLDYHSKEMNRTPYKTSRMQTVQGCRDAVAKAAGELQKSKGKSVQVSEWSE
jgi:hypothetical protein